MTDQKQAPERYSPAMLFSTQKPATMHKELHGEFVTYVAYAALTKQRDELAAEIEHIIAIKDMHQNMRHEYFERAEKAEAERDYDRRQSDHKSTVIDRLNAANTKLQVERDQALAQSAAREIAMRDLAAACEEEVGIAFGFCCDETGDEYNQGWVDCTEHWLEEIRALPLSPDGQKALNDMLSRAWDEGHTVGVVWPEKERNPYRKGAT